MVSTRLEIRWKQALQRHAVKRARSSRAGTDERDERMPLGGGEIAKLLRPAAGAPQALAQLARATAVSREPRFGMFSAQAFPPPLRPPSLAHPHAPPGLGRG